MQVVNVAVELAPVEAHITEGHVGHGTQTSTRPPTALRVQMSIPAGDVLVSMKLSGLFGGHTGIDIHKARAALQGLGALARCSRPAQGRANALILLGRLLNEAIL
jgi:hypothetical protein